MDIPDFATSEILRMRDHSRQGMPQEDSTGLGKTALIIHCLKEPRMALLSHYLFHLNISFDYELSKVQKGFNR